MHESLNNINLIVNTLNCLLLDVCSTLDITEAWGYKYSTLYFYKIRIVF